MRTYLVITAAAAVVSLSFGCGKESSQQAAAPTTTTNAAAAKAPDQVTMSSAALKAAGIQIESIQTHQAGSTLTLTGAVEPNQQQIQQVTPLVGGRVDVVYASLGTAVRRGATLALMSSPEVSEMHGKLLEAQAKLNQAEATLRRTQKLTAIGAAAGKDAISAEADAQTARADVAHLRDALRTVSALPEGGQHNIAAVAMRAPIDGVVIERNVNPGSGIEANKPAFTVANLSNVWVIANVPEAQMPLLRVGANAQVQAAALGPEPLKGKVTYIDPTLNEGTRSGRARIEVRNPQGALKVGMFANVTVEGTARPTPVVSVPEDAIQRVREKDVVFVEQPANSGTFHLREVVAGEKTGDRRVITSGLTAGERVATKGSFTIKAQLLKSEFAEGD